MKIEYFHASKYGNGAMVAEEFKKQMAAKGVVVNVHHVGGTKQKEMPPAMLWQLLTFPNMPSAPLPMLLEPLRQPIRPTPE
jgi:hypothetical protein